MVVRPALVGAAGALGVAFAIASPAWNHHFGTSGFWVPLSVNVIGTGAAVVSARRRVRLQALSGELAGAERRLQAILRNLDEAVTVQDATGRSVYANDAAAALLGLSSPEAVITAEPGEIMRRFEVTREDGTPVPLEELPAFRILRGEPAEPTLVRNVVTATGEERWLLNRATAVAEDGGDLAFIVNVIEDVTEAKRAERGARLLAEAGHLLASSTELEPVLAQVAHLVVPDLADWCGVDVLGERGAIELRAVAHADPEREAAAWELRRRYPVSAEGAEGLPAVLRDGTSWLQPAVTRADLEAYAHDAEHLRLLDELGVGSILIVPMLAGPRTVGAITLVSARPDGFDRGDVALAEELGRRAGWAVHNARLNRERAEIAHILQASLLPAELPQMPRWQTASLYRPTGEANEVGGDFYDAFAVKDGWVVVVGDVAGKGARAAAVTGLARHTLRTGVRLSDRVGPAFEELNGALRDGPELALCTVAGVRLADGWARVLSAGHPLPLLVRDGHARPVGRTGPLLGAYADADWPSVDLDLRPADVLVLYTDGVIDAVRDDGERFGEQRLLEAAAGASPTAEATVTAIGRALDRFSPVGQRDDVAVVAIAWEGVLELREQLPHTEDSAVAARRSVGRSLDGALPAPLLDRVLVLTSELVTNALRHGGTGPIELRTRVDTRSLRVEVRDTGTGFVPQPPRPGLHGGFGLLLVGEGADRWGVETDDGSCVWFEIDLTRPG